MVKLKKALIISFSLILWIVIWEITALLVNNRAFFSGAIDTFRALGHLVLEANYWKSISSSILRILIGFSAGVIIGVALSILSVKFKAIYVFLGIGMSVIKSAPVASIIMLVWLFFGASTVPSIISILMVVPIVWQNLVDGYNSVSRDLNEVAQVFGISRFRRLKLLIVPAVMRFLVPATLTSVGLAWKAGVAAEIIAVAKNSIGYYIKESKDYFESDKMLAWTVTVITISLLFEHGIRFLIKRYNEHGAAS